jgi:hypothetical protein
MIQSLEKKKSPYCWPSYSTWLRSVLDRILDWPIAARVTELKSGLMGCKRPIMIFEPIHLLVEASALQQIKCASLKLDTLQHAIQCIDFFAEV